MGRSWPLASSATLVMSAGGRLSITKKPRSSRTRAASERPAPDMPLMIVTSSDVSYLLFASLTGRWAFPRYGPGCADPWGPARLTLGWSYLSSGFATGGHDSMHRVQCSVGRRGHRVGEPRQALQLLERQLAHPLDAAELAEQAASPR